MTVVRSLLMPEASFEIIPSGDNGPMLYRVMVTPVIGRINPSYGSVVTHLSLQDWCQMHGWRLVQQYPGTRLALPGERTDLF